MKVKFKIMIIYLLISIFIISSISSFAVDKCDEIQVFFKNITFKLNNKNIKLSEKPFIYKNRIFVPLRFISEKLGFKVYWNNKKNIISISTIEDFPEADYINGEKFIYGEILKIDRKNKKLNIYQHIDDNSASTESNLKISNDIKIIFQRNDKKMNLDFKDLKIGDNVGIILNKEGLIRGIIVGS
ncbi:Copper amine oxidase N-terminal domain-containing protein [Caminicella sporogenes DSM 14501]|uniref:Copper amine oxidase N-terminal domain-containing protein n=1 Tax=Caminicella sporogenes DSM 14501 TaxID=1121266 RepID=A0A1M6QLI4_9FIRM|nr:copper amine oxidase N-terminal domain-containing protein [Caminicella sporogenes]RKD25269.1 hypothetical protein BET04_03375 [Caminicella sporogenes]WIF95262.1 copper amine oxidase N-terminal domain-containing protein [Caminicella sporogenes]SHK21101.1 Copper amine oxidase N-terminal domain-containing protein [Caminicella sporogenes DSM 14501]